MSNIWPISEAGRRAAPIIQSPAFAAAVMRHGRGFWRRTFHLLDFSARCMSSQLCCAKASNSASPRSEPNSIEKRISAAPFFTHAGAAAESATMASPETCGNRPDKRPILENPFSSAARMASPVSRHI
jgi:hypothetical protein